MSNRRMEAPLLLLIACSQRKAAGVERGRAWEVYDGQLFRVLKNLRRKHPWGDEELPILIVSARYGVVRPDRTIATYDERLTSMAASRESNRWADQLKRAVSGARYRAVHVNLGRLYLAALPDLADMFPGTPIDYATGGIGVRNAQTRRWVLRQLQSSPGRA
jgi:hypothetical protein